MSEADYEATGNCLWPALSDGFYRMSVHPKGQIEIAAASAADQTQKPEDIMTAKTYSAEHTALLIVDPYNDFMSEGGKLYNAIKETADASGMFANLRKLIPAVRAAGIQVFIVPHHRSDAHGHDYDGWQHVNLFNPEFGPQKGDVIIKEHWAQSGFANTDLDMQLKQHGIQKLIFVGLVANTCIESTARFGMELGYHVTLVIDGTAAFSSEGMKAAATNAPMFAHAIVKTNELLGQLAA